MAHKRGASPSYLSIMIKFNGDLSYRVGEARRAHPKGLARLPNISPQNCTSIVTLLESLESRYLRMIPKIYRICFSFFGVKKADSEVPLKTDFS